MLFCDHSEHVQPRQLRRLEAILAEARSLAKQQQSYHSVGCFLISSCFCYGSICCGKIRRLATDGCWAASVEAAPVENKERIAAAIV